MLQYSNYVILNEKVENLFLNDMEKRKQYVDVLWNMLQSSYKESGGLKTSGFDSKEDMINNIPFWKVIKSKGEIVAALFYKQKDGRKRVATATNGTIAGKKMLAQAMRKEPERAFFEVSKGSWGFIRRLLLTKDLKQFMIPIEKVKEMNPNKKIYSLDEIPTQKLVDGGLNPNDEKNKPFIDFIYARKINGELEPKVMIGTIGKHIIPK